MTHVQDTAATNRRHSSGVGFWYVCHANLGPDSSGTRFRRRLEHCMFYSKPESDVQQHVIEMMTYDWLMI